MTVAMHCGLWQHLWIKGVIHFSCIPLSRDTFRLYPCSCIPAWPFDLPMQGDTCNGCNMGMTDLPDIYALGLRALMCMPGGRGPGGWGHACPRAVGPRAEGIHIRQITNGHVTSIMYHFVPIANNTSSFNLTSNCHTCLWGYKYKLLMPCSQEVEYLHSPTIFR